MASVAFPQATGIKGIVDFYHPTMDVEGASKDGMIGFGVDRDFNERLGAGLEVRFGTKTLNVGPTLELLYNTKYFLSDNTSTAIYVGTFIGYQRIAGTIYTSVNTSTTYSTSVETPVSRTQIPLGVRLGLRGGLEGFFAELYVHAGMALGSGDLARGVSSQPFFISTGFAVGGGW
jgi:hypothetical protein